MSGTFAVKLLITDAAAKCFIVSAIVLGFLLHDTNVLFFLAVSFCYQHFCGFLV